jgi:hypothetical protein
LIIFLTYKATQAWASDYAMYAMVAQCSFMSVTKVVKLISLFVREPSDLIFLPVSIIFGYFHGLIKLYALLTLRIVSRVPQFHSCSWSLTLPDFLGQPRRW